MAIMINSFQVDERYSNLLLPNLFFGDWMVPGVTYNDEYEKDATGAGGIWVRKLKTTAGSPQLPGADYVNTNPDAELAQIVLNNSYDRSTKIHAAQEAQTGVGLAAAYYELNLRQVREDMNQSGLSCLYTEGTVGVAPSANTAKAKILGSAAAMAKNKIKPTVALCSPDFYYSVVAEAGSQYIPDINNRINDSGTVGNWLGINFVLANGLSTVAASEYINYAGTKKSVTAANLNAVEYVLLDPRVFHCVTSVTSMRLINSEHFPGQLAQCTVVNGYRVTNAAGVHVATKSA